MSGIGTTYIYEHVEAIMYVCMYVCTYIRGIGTVIPAIVLRGKTGFVRITMLASEFG
jgi:hypothetical protein